MSSLSPVLSESYDDVLAAVQESSRGRWFLEEYAKRLKAGETNSVLESIHKLESMIAALPVPTASSPAVDRVRAAIEAARAELGGLKPEGKPLSNEAKMFAQLAKLSRQAFAAGTSPDVTKGFEVALKLVTELEDSFTFAPQTTSPAKPETQAPRPQAEQQKYFHQDADVFAPVPTGASTSVQFKTPAPTKPPEDPVNRGAKLTIHRGAEQPSPDPTPGPVPANLQSVSHTPAETKPEGDKPRIVIIRRKPEELGTVPLADQVA